MVEGNEIFEVNPEYREIIRLHEMLEAAGIPHTFERLFDGWQVCYLTSDSSERIADAAEHLGSYGHSLDKLELMGLLHPSEKRLHGVAGFLTAEEVFVRIRRHYMRTRPRSGSALVRAVDVAEGNIAQAEFISAEHVKSKGDPGRGEAPAGESAKEEQQDDRLDNGLRDAGNSAGDTAGRNRRRMVVC